MQKTGLVQSAAALSRVLLIICGSLLTTACLPKRQGATQEFYVQHADSIQQGCDAVNYEELGVACHRLKNGDFKVIGVREYSDRGLDQERFRKVTFVVPADLKQGDRIELTASETKAFYSTGLSYMPGKAGCYGSAISGSLLITRLETPIIELQVDAVFDLKSPAGYESHCSLREYRTTILAKRKEIGELGPWEGVPGDADYFEEGTPYGESTHKHP